ncbi:MAG: hypothetical protein IKP29_03615 [Pseudobutyrivibrio sp.]|nr:hypothetical protein [Pseudobutyrivibrio sp.]
MIAPLVESYGIDYMLFTLICYLLCRLIASVYLYTTVRKLGYRDGAFAVALIYCVSIIGDISFSPSSIIDISMILILCWISRFCTTKKIYYIVISVIAVVSMIGGYWYYGLLRFSLPNEQMLEMRLWTYAFVLVAAYLPILIIKIVSHFRYMDNIIAGRVLSIYWIVFMVAILAIKPTEINYTRIFYGWLMLFFWYPLFALGGKRKDITIVGEYGLRNREAKEVALLPFCLAGLLQLISFATTSSFIIEPASMSLYVVLAMLIATYREEKGLKLLRVAIIISAFCLCGLNVYYKYF